MWNHNKLLLLIASFFLSACHYKCYPANDYAYNSNGKDISKYIYQTIKITKTVEISAKKDSSAKFNFNFLNRLFSDFFGVSAKENLNVSPAKIVSAEEKAETHKIKLSNASAVCIAADKKEKTSLFLTVAHATNMSLREQDILILGAIHNLKDIKLIDMKLTGLDIDGNEINLDVLDRNEKTDLSLMKAKGYVCKNIAKLPGYDFSVKFDIKKMIGSKLINVGCPAGYCGKNVIMVYDGRICGEDGDDIFVSNSVCPGSSGSPFYLNGLLFGVAKKVHVRFHHIAMISRPIHMYQFFCNNKEKLNNHVDKNYFGNCNNAKKLK